MEYRMVNLKAIVLVALILLLPSFAVAQASNSNWLTQAERAKFDQLRISGSEALYNLDYEAARRIFKEMAVAFPNYPAGPQFLADTLLIEALYQTRRLQASLYNSDSFYSENEDKADPKLVDQFRTYTRTARQMVEARLKQYPNDTEALYFFRRN
jgi:outer membrane protein assembly factor BamD (BamD/ComL family)